MRAIDMRCRPPIKALKGDFLLEPSFENYERARFHGDNKPAPTEPKTIEKCLVEMDMADIQIGVVPCRKGDYGDAWNDQIVQLMTEYPGRFYGFVGVDACFAEEAVQDIQRYVVDGPMVGVNLEPYVAPKGGEPLNIDDERLFPIYEFCEKHDIPMTIMTGGMGIISGKPYQAQERIHTLSVSFPNLRICFTHGNWPYFRECAIEMYSNPNLFVSPDSFLANYVGWRDWVDAANYIFQDQIMFGTCYPVQPYYKMVDQYVHKAGFRVEVLSKVMYDNAARFIGIDQHTAYWISPFAKK